MSLAEIGRRACGHHRRGGNQSERNVNNNLSLVALLALRQRTGGTIIGHHAKTLFTRRYHFEFQRLRICTICTNIPHFPKEQVTPNLFRPMKMSWNGKKTRNSDGTQMVRRKCKVACCLVDDDGSWLTVSCFL